jgi:hypothetical protein
MIALGTFGASLGTEIGYLGFRALTATCSKSVEGLTYFLINSHPSFAEWTQLLVETDILVKIKKIEQLSKEFKESEESGTYFKESIKMSIIDIDQVIQNINQTCLQMQEKHKYHESLYLNTWRSADCSLQISSLKSSCGILEKRFDDLFKINSISIPK